MKCTLCNQEIENYNPAFNHLKIDETHSADICLVCSEKFTKWQGSIIAKLFPTKSMKKIYNKN
jgi:hypothetical protein